MNLKEIQELIKMVKKAELNELKVREGDFAISIKNSGGENPVTTFSPVVQPIAQNVATGTPKQEGEKTETNLAQGAVASANEITFRSPMVGTFYRKPGADKELYVKVGDTIKTGTVLCIIEAMKLFNEIEYDGAEGKIVKILAEDSSPVEYDQPLFIIEKTA